MLAPLDLLAHQWATQFSSGEWVAPPFLLFVSCLPQPQSSPLVVFQSPLFIIKLPQFSPPSAIYCHILYRHLFPFPFPCMVPVVSSVCKEALPLLLFLMQPLSLLPTCLLVAAPSPTPTQSAPALYLHLARTESRITREKWQNSQIANVHIKNLTIFGSAQT